MLIDWEVVGVVLTNVANLEGWTGCPSRGQVAQGLVQSLVTHTSATVAAASLLIWLAAEKPEPWLRHFV